MSVIKFENIAACVFDAYGTLFDFNSAAEKYSSELEGKADSNNDNKITNGELLDYMDKNVSMKASELGRQQNPSLAGDPNKVLINYR